MAPFLTLLPCFCGVHFQYLYFHTIDPSEQMCQQLLCPIELLGACFSPQLFSCSLPAVAHRARGEGSGRDERRLERLHPHFVGWWQRFNLFL